ncbi:hypothetical protein [Deefgea rivuli]|uniref:hypothetical protein n=1 Tax=Deefgea rivuli TaxID=400948 RepID=UPI000482C374|nr:hypothetical protein [Deefgea rivuli]
MKKVSCFLLSLMCASSWAQTVTIQQDGKAVATIELSKNLDINMQGDQCLADKLTSSIRCTGNVKLDSRNGSIKLQAEDIVVKD